MKRAYLPRDVIKYHLAQSAFGHMEMDDLTAKMWIVYCWRGIQDDDPNYLMKMWRVAAQSEGRGCKVCLERMTFDVRKRLWDHIMAKIFKLTICSQLKRWDSFLFVVSRRILDSEAYSKERAYALDRAREHPKGTLPLIGLMYI